MLHVLNNIALVIGWFILGPALAAAATALVTLLVVIVREAWNYRKYCA